MNNNPLYFRGKYRIPSARLAGWDYSDDGEYYITICTAGRVCWFGNIENQQMKYSHIGQIALNEWEKSFALRAELFCDIFVIMPNHIHALLRIVNGNGRRDARPCVSTEPNVPTEPYIPTGIAIRQPKSISSFVAGFKSGVTVAARKTHPSFGWQPRFHDHIIRNQDEYHRIFNYITNNPANWKNDSFFNY